MSCSEDMEDIASAITARMPKARVYSCHKIEEVGDKGIMELGETIADEIAFEIEKAQAQDILDKVTLIGHSCGGLVLRAALIHLEQFKDVLHGFVTLATPHYGYLHSKSRILSIGMWAVSRVTKNPTVAEMRLSDSNNITETTLYKLSEKPGLEWFKYVLLIGSHQDSYAPLESALVQISERSQTYRHADAYKYMCNNLQSKLKN